MQKSSNINPIIIVPGEPNSIFSEIFFKSLKNKKIKNIRRPIILIGSADLLVQQMKKLNYKFKIKILEEDSLFKHRLDNNNINILNIKYRFKKPFDKLSIKSTSYIINCFKTALRISKKIKIAGLINGPISKSHFNVKNLIGITEYLSKLNDKYSKEVMLIYNKNLSISPITTHVPLKQVSKKITINKIISNVKTINEFYKIKFFKKKINFAITGLNPHCESKYTDNEEDRIIKPAIKKLKKGGYKINGPFAADTLFIKSIRDKFDVIIGMYHDQVLTPMKTIHEYNAINITLGLDFIRLSPDHGPNVKDLGKNISNPESMIQCLLFLK